MAEISNAYCGRNGHHGHVATIPYLLDLYSNRVPAPGRSPAPGSPSWSRQMAAVRSTYAVVKSLYDVFVRSLLCLLSHPGRRRRSKTSHQLWQTQCHCHCPSSIATNQASRTPIAGRLGSCPTPPESLARSCLRVNGRATCTISCPGPHKRNHAGRSRTNRHECTQVY